MELRNHFIVSNQLSEQDIAKITTQEVKEVAGYKSGKLNINFILHLGQSAEDFINDTSTVVIKYNQYKVPRILNRI